MEIEKISAVIFDLDGTLYDNKHLPIKLILADIPNMWVLGAERKARKAIMGEDHKDAEGVYNALFNKMAEVKKNLTVEKASKWYHDKYMPLQCAVLRMYYEPRPFVPELLQSLHDRGIKIILYSDYGHAEEKVAALDIPGDLFDGNVSAAKMGGLKPCKASMERLMAMFNLSVESTLYVGDRDDTDGGSASAVGLEFYNVKKSGWDNLLQLLKLEIG